jgi:hypothetical protein
LLFLYDDGAPLVEADVFRDSRGAGKAEGDVDREGRGSVNVVLGFLAIVRSIWTVVVSFVLLVERLLPFFRPIVALELGLER